MTALALDENATVAHAGKSGARILAFPGANCPTVAPEAPCLREADRECLNRLRWFALKSRLAPKPDLERACFLLAGEANVTLERYATAFFRGLATTASREMTIYRPGTRGASDDEIWLLRLLEAKREGKDAAAKALVAWRVRPEGRRWLRFLAASLAEAL